MWKGEEPSNKYVKMLSCGLRILSGVACSYEESGSLISLVRLGHRATTLSLQSPVWPLCPVLVSSSYSKAEIQTKLQRKRKRKKS